MTGILVAVLSLVSAGWIIAVWRPGRLASQRQRAVAGGLVCQDAIWRFGLVDAEAKPSLAHDFTLTNESQEVVRLGKAHSTCGCVVADGYSQELPPGKTTQLSVNITIPRAPGLFHKELIIPVEGTNPSWLPLRIVGEIKANAKLYATPALINFGTIRKGETRDREIHVRRYDGLPVTAPEVSVGGKGLQCFSEATAADHQPNLIVRVTFSADGLPVGRYSATISVGAQQEGYPDLVIPVEAIVAGPGSGSARSIVIPESQRGTLRPFTLRAETLGHSPDGNCGRERQGCFPVEGQVVEQGDRFGCRDLLVTCPIGLGGRPDVRAKIVLRFENLIDNVDFPAATPPPREWVPVINIVPPKHVASGRCRVSLTLSERKVCSESVFKFGARSLWSSSAWDWAMVCCS
jgi:hypothetical protein